MAEQDPNLDSLGNPLPPGWQCFIDDEQQIPYYYHESTQESSWEIPASGSTTAGEVPSPHTGHQDESLQLQITPIVYSQYSTNTTVSNDAAETQSSPAPSLTQLAVPQATYGGNGAESDRSAHSDAELHDTTVVGSSSSTTTTPRASEIAYESAALRYGVRGTELEMGSISAYRGPRDSRAGTTNSMVSASTTGGHSNVQLIDSSPDSKTKVSNTKTKTRSSSSTDALPSIRSRRFSQADEDDEFVLPARWVVLTRVMVCALAIAFLWITTLAYSRAIAGVFVDVPRTSEVIRTWDVAIDITRLEKRWHNLCADVQVNQCQNRLDAQINQYTRETINRQQRNRQVLQSTEVSSAKCNSASVRLYENFVKYVDIDVSRVSWLPECSLEERQKVLELTGDIGAVGSNTYALSADFARATSRIMDRNLESIRNRTAYDKAYVTDKTGELGNVAVNIRGVSAPHIGKINAAFNVTAALEQYTACVAKLNDPNCPQAGVMDTYKGIEQSLNNSYKALDRIARANYNQAKAYEANVENVLSDIDSFLSALSVFKTGLAALGFTDAFPSTFAAPLNLIGIPDLYRALAIEDIFNAGLPSFQANLSLGLGKVGAEINAAVLALAADVNLTTLGIPTVLEDYNPPPVDLTMQESQQEQEDLTSDFLVDSRTSLKNNEGTSAETSFNRSVESVRNLIGDLELTNSLNFTFQSFGGELIQFTTFLSAFSELVALLLVADYLFRAFKTLYYIVRYWNKSAADLPIIDVSKQRDYSDQPVTVKAARCATSRFMLFGGTMVLFLLALAALIQAYIPVYEQYKEGCLEGDGGTVVTRNAFSFAWNNAALDGNGKLTDGIESYDRKRTKACGNFSDSANTQADSVNRLEQAQVEFAVATSNLDLFVKCVDGSPGKFPDAIAYEVQYGVQSPFTVVANAESCQQRTEVQAAVLENAVFNCSLLKPCLTTCTGPNEGLLRQATYESGCRSESVVHSGVFTIFVTVLVYVCLNVSRMLFMGGVTRLYWRSLTHEGFIYKASCSRTGKMVANARVDLEKEVKTTRKWLQRKALLMFFLSLCAHLPYIIVLSTMPNVVPRYQYYSDAWAPNGNA
jgi:WW domain